MFGQIYKPLEVPARLITSRSRRGQVIWQCDFEAGNPLLSTSGTSALLTTAGQVIAGGQSLRITNSGFGDFIVRKLLGLPVPMTDPHCRMAFELLWNYTDSTIDTYEFNSTITGAATTFYVGLRWNILAPQWEYRDYQGNWQAMPGPPRRPIVGTETVNYLRLSFDCYTGKYISITINETTANMSAESIQPVTVASDPTHWMFELKGSGGAATAASLTIDDLILTGWEP